MQKAKTDQRAIEQILLRQCLVLRLGFHSQKAAAPPLAAMFVSVMTSLSREICFPVLQRTACLFLRKGAGALDTSYC